MLNLSESYLSESFLSHFSVIKDPRMKNHNYLHEFMDIIVITLLAVICGANDFVEVAEFGKRKYEWLKTFLNLPYGIPSHDTFNRVFCLINPQEFEACFLSWVKTIAKKIGGEVISIDGKQLRRSQDKRHGHPAITIVSAWANANQLVLGQVKVDDKSNEITAIPELLKVLDIESCTITIDAIGTQKKIAEQIINQGGEYVLAVKANQENLYNKAKDLFEQAKLMDFNAMWYKEYKTVEKDHGRIETRKYIVLPLMYFPEFSIKWKGLKSLIYVERERQVIGREKETVYYMSSLPPQEENKIAHAIRTHWGVENNLHWCLDISFREDECRVRKGHGAENLSIIRRFALNLLKSDKTIKAGIAVKRKAAGWDNSYLKQLLLSSGI
jgi:predicted transposase YbfD/YdcC